MVGILLFSRTQRQNSNELQSICEVFQLYCRRGQREFDRTRKAARFVDGRDSAEADARSDWLRLSGLRFVFDVGSNLPLPRKPNLSDSVVTRISTFGPIVSWFFRDVGNPGNGLHILQTKFNRHQQPERCSVIHVKGLTVQVCGEQGL
jgi:hypothetical protein